MILNYEEIKTKNILTDASDNEFADGSYNLTISQIIDMKGSGSQAFTLKPQGMAYVIFKEKLTMPSNVIGFAHVKTSLTKRGIMATNIGIIDPNYVGYISTLLINFGKSDCVLTEGDSALRVTFANMNGPTKKIAIKNNNLDLKKYTQKTQKTIGNLDEKFLNLNSVATDIKSSVYKALIGLSIVFTAANFVVGGYFNYKNSNERELDRAVKKYEMSLSTTDENNKLLNEQLKRYDFMLQSLQDSLKSQAVEIKKLKKK
ncbi:MAG: hypothetical protein K0Q95_2143 [Bacteroidota bacterium]|jgi:deoxycytidine triphosphate deaminase|nr:hypothetical protein [Bacteroidota bacterium]